jgi:hypothetical protein
MKRFRQEKKRKWVKSEEKRIIQKGKGKEKKTQERHKRGRRCQIINGRKRKNKTDKAEWLKMINIKKKERVLKIQSRKNKSERKGLRLKTDKKDGHRNNKAEIERQSMKPKERTDKTHTHTHTQTKRKKKTDEEKKETEKGEEREKSNRQKG